MPSDANGVFSLVTGYLATTGTTIQTSQHNPVLEDIATGLTARLPRNGSAAMTGPLQIADGTSSAPGFTFATNTAIGFYKTASGFGASGFISGVPPGFVGDWPGVTAPAGWLFCFGQSVLKADYPLLFAAIGLNFGGDTLHFTIPDLRGKTTAGRSDMGGVDLGNLTGANNIGVNLGAQSVTLTLAQTPAHDHGVVTGTESALHNHNMGLQMTGTKAGSPGVVTNTPSAAEQFVSPAVNNTPGTESATHFHAIPSAGSGTSHTNVQPTFILNKIIFAGV